MNEKTNELIEALAAKFGTTAEHLWGVLVQQATVNAITDSLAAVAFLALFSACAWLAWKKWEEWDAEIVASICACALILGVIAIIISVIATDSIIVAIWNPEYFALNKLLP